MPGRFPGVVLIEHEQPAMPRRKSQDHAAGEAGVAGDDRSCQATPAASSQRDHLSGVAVAHDGAYRAECLQLMGLSAAGVVAAQE